MADYEIIKEGTEDVMKIDYSKGREVPSLADSKFCMSDVVDKILKVPRVNRVIFVQTRNYQYSTEQIDMLREIANLYSYLTKQKKFLNVYSYGKDFRYAGTRFNAMQYLILNLLKGDPVGCYVELKRFLREEKVLQERIKDAAFLEASKKYLEMLNEFYFLLDKSKIIVRLKEEVAGFSIGNREIYRELFRPIITPNFMITRLMAQPPLDGHEVDSYSIGDVDVMIFKVPGDIAYLYHVVPPEFKISEDQYELIEVARTVLAEHKPEAEEFIDPERMRYNFFNIGRDLISELATHRGMDLDYAELEEMVNILVRYTVGFGFVETLLSDSKIQDITLNGPVGETPIFVVHADYGECKTNIVPSVEDGESWATKFRLLSGRPLDEANPVLDTELILPSVRARVAVITKPLNPFGLGYALRRHRDKPWTLPLFIDNGMLNPLAAGLISFFVDGARTMLVAGTRSSGKTSLLGSVLVEIMRKFRLITVEDSVTGDCEIIVRKSKKIKRTTIGQLIDSSIEKYGCWYNLSEHEILGNDEDVEILSMNKKGIVEFNRPSKLIRHKVNKPVYRILTRTGREINVTGDHSLFNLGDAAEIKEVKVGSLKENDFIAVPRKLNFCNKERKYLNLLDYLDKLNKGYFEGECVGELFKRYCHEINQLAKEHGHNRSLRSHWRRREFIPLKIVKDLVSLGYDVSVLKDSCYRGSKNSGTLPVLIELDENLLTFIGLWIADGCYDRSSVLLSVVEEENREIAYALARQYGFNVKFHSDSFSLMLNSTTLKTIMREVLDLKGNAYTKRIPEWVYNLSDGQIANVLKGIFSGDGCVADKEIVIPLASLNLLKDIQTLLLNFGIIFRIGVMRKDKTYNASISSLKFWKIFKEKIGILPKDKLDKLNRLCLKESTHDCSDVIPLNLGVKKKVKQIYSDFRDRDYIYRDNNVGREKLAGMLLQIKEESEIISNLRMLSLSDVFWDRIKKIEVIEDFDGFVYDLSVPENESFICNNVIAHNTLEIPGEALRKLGYNIQSLKVRAALVKGGGEMAADEGIRTSLRLGDSALIVGEVRSTEAIALYEAMRIGAMANVVAGTIHGDSPYGVFDRVVNDLGVPRTSFKATDLILVANPVKTADRLKFVRRLMSITEVRKEWEEDPLKEGGFVDLMKYNPKTDMLEPTDSLINGDSEIIKSVAGNVKEWAGNWDAVWSNILLRAEIKKKLVNYANEVKNKNLLEAKFVIQSNDEFHRISESVSEEAGELDNRRILHDWLVWLKKASKNVER